MYIVAGLSCRWQPRDALRDVGCVQLQRWTLQCGKLEPVELS